MSSPRHRNGRHENDLDSKAGSGRRVGVQAGPTSAPEPVQVEISDPLIGQGLDRARGGQIEADASAVGPVPQRPVEHALPGTAVR